MRPSIIRAQYLRQAPSIDSIKSAVTEASTSTQPSLPAESLLCDSMGPIIGQMIRSAGIDGQIVGFLLKLLRFGYCGTFEVNESCMDSPVVLDNE